MDRMIQRPFTVFRNVPDEVLENILSYNLSVPYDLFCSPYQHFGKYDLTDLSSSVVIEVCRRWMRVGTPLLYETVVLRSKAQVLALRAALDGNLRLCKCIKRLRVEDTYGMAIADVMQMCTAATDVWVSLRLQSNGLETGKGLQKGLKYLNPRSIIFWDFSMGKPRPWSLRVPLFEALNEVLPTWKRLDTIRYLSEPGFVDHWAQTMISNLHELCPQLKYIFFADYYFASYPSLLSHLSKVKTLKKIWILEGVDASSLSNRDLSEATSEQYTEILKKVAFYQPDSPQPPPRAAPSSRAPCSNLNFACLKAADPITRAYILWKILQHHTGFPDHRHADEKGLWNAPAFLIFAQVCRDFRAVAVSFLYSDIELKTWSQCMALEEILSSTHYGAFIRHIKGDIATLLLHPEFHIILRKAVNLVSLQRASEATRAITCDDLSVISILAGKSVRTLDVSIGDHLGIPSLTDWASLSVSLWGLRHLTNLQWSSDMPIDPESLHYTTFKDSLPMLGHLTYASSLGTFMSCLSRMELPELTQVEIIKAPFNVHICQEFLQAHGKKLQHLDLPFTSYVPGLFTKLCPEVWSFRLDIAGKAPVYPETFNEVRSNEALEDLYICTSEEKPRYDRELRFLENVDFSGFHALESIHLEMYDWPTEQYPISKSLMVRLAEKWWLERKVKMVDKNGTAWKPRLKAPTSARRNTGRKQLVTLT